MGVREEGCKLHVSAFAVVTGSSPLWFRIMIDLLVGHMAFNTYCLYHCLLVHIASLYTSLQYHYLMVEHY